MRKNKYICGQKHFEDMDTVNKEKAIRAIVSSFVEAYASAFSDRHLSEVDMRMEL